MPFSRVSSFLADRRARYLESVGLQRAGASSSEQVGRFSLLREVQGRPGTWTARRRHDGELVVVHRVSSSGRAVAVLTDARRAIEVDHPCVVRVRSAEAAGAEVLVASDYVDGETYPSLLVAAYEHRRPITLKLTLRMLCDALAGLSAMHGGTGGMRHDRIVFGRLAPDDLLVGADGLTRVVLGARQSRSPSSIGYLAPEIALGGDDDADERSDVYAVGVMLWEALAAQRLYDESTLEGLVSAQLRGPIPLPQLPDDAPWAEPVLAVAMRALAPDPGDRYVAAGAMLEALLEAAGRRVGTAGDIVELVESLVGPFVRARRREAAMPAAASNSDIRATTPDVEDQTLRPIGEHELPTEVLRNPLTQPAGPPAGDEPTLVPRLNGDDDADELKTEIQPDLLRALPAAHVNAPQLHAADREPPTRQVDSILTARRPSFHEEPSLVTSTIPPDVSRDLLARQRQLGEAEPTITKSVAGGVGLLPLDDEPEATTSVEDSSVSVSIGGPTLPRPPADSIATLDQDQSVVTAKRAAPTMQSAMIAPQGFTRRASTADNEEVEELLAKTATLDRSALPQGPPMILEETVNMDQGAELRRAIAAVDATVDMRRAEQAAAFPMGMRTVPLAMPVPGYDAGPQPQQPSSPMMMGYLPPSSSVVAPPPMNRPPSHPQMNGHLPPVVFPPVSTMPTPSRMTLGEEAGRSSALLGVFTFFLVLASLLVLAWLTFPYWRLWAGL